MSHYSFVNRTRFRSAAGDLVGVSTRAGYSNNEGEMLSLAVVEPEYAGPGTEVVLTWGEPDGGSRKSHVERHEQTTIRAVVAPAPWPGRSGR